MRGLVTGGACFIGSHTVAALRAAGHDIRIETSETTADLGVEATPWEMTARDTIRWLHSAGHITRRRAGAAVAGAA